MKSAREMTVIHFDGRYCAPLFIAVADAYADGAPMVLGVDPNGVSGVSVAGVRIPVDDDGRMLVNFRRGADPFPHYSISDIINHKIAPDKLAGKIVLVGATAHGLGDRGVTPDRRRHGTRRDPRQRDRQHVAGRLHSPPDRGAAR